jgi:hypothetical protein
MDNDLRTSFRVKHVELIRGTTKDRAALNTPGNPAPIQLHGHVLKCISRLPSHFHQFGLLVALASA